jgi:hypothetical protein
LIGPLIGFDFAGWNTRGSIAELTKLPIANGPANTPLAVYKGLGLMPLGAYCVAFYAFIKSLKTNTVKVASWSDEDCNAALAKLASRVEANLQDMIWDQDLVLSFTVNGEVFAQRDFFNRLVVSRINAVQELRRLLSAFVEAQSQMKTRCWEDGEAGAYGLASALRALVLLDRRSIDLWRRYLCVRDGEHEAFCHDLLLPEFIEMHGWSDQEAIRFGIFCAVNWAWGCGGYTSHPGRELLRAAARMMSVEEFVDTLSDEVRHRAWPDLWKDQTDAWYFSGFAASLDRNSRYEMSIAELASRLARRA